MGFELVGRVWTPETFTRYLRDVQLGWADSVCVHHTAEPSLAQRPSGLKVQHIKNIQSFYEGLGWSAGPHLFVSTDDQIFGMSSLWRRGVHAKSFNRSSIGLEMLGDFDNESPTSGRGLDVVETTAQTVAVLLMRMGLQANNETVLFHRDDPRTRKSCPGVLVNKAWFLDKVRGYMGATAPTQPMTLEERVARLEKIWNLTT